MCNIFLLLVRGLHIVIFFLNVSNTICNEATKFNGDVFPYVSKSCYPSSSLMQFEVGKRTCFLLHDFQSIKCQHRLNVGKLTSLS